MLSPSMSVYMDQAAVTPGGCVPGQGPVPATAPLYCMTRTALIWGKSSQTQAPGSLGAAAS